MKRQTSNSRGRETGERRPRMWRLLVSSLVLVTSLQSASSEAVTRAFVTAFESSFSRVSIDKGGALTGIIVLGGSDERLREAGRLARMYTHARLVVSGGGDVANIRRQLGRDIASSRIEIEELSRSTFENALYSKESVRPGLGERWLLVTSATHMPRAIGAFRSVGFEVEPWPVHDLASETDQAASVLHHEIIGLVWYWLIGRTNAIFPQPHAERSAS